MYFPLPAPAVPEEADGKEEGAGYEHGEAVFGLPHAAAAGYAEADVDFVDEARAGLCADDVAEGEGEVVQAGDGDGLVVALRPEEGEGYQGEVHEAERVGYVEGEDLQDGLCGQ